MLEVNGQLYEWDEDKNLSNIQKHGISFDEAASVFGDENAVYAYDERNSDEEDRFVIIGFSEVPRLLIVCHCYRESGEVTRIISARKATKPESQLYESGGTL